MKFLISVQLISIYGLARSIKELWGLKNIEIEYTKPRIGILKKDMLILRKQDLY